MKTKSGAGLAGNWFFLAVGGAVIYGGWQRNDHMALWVGWFLILLTAVMMMMDHKDLEGRIKEAKADSSSAYRLACGICGHIAPTPEWEPALRHIQDHLARKHGVTDVYSGH